jgi:ParB family chromosome partitioning protein
MSSADRLGQDGEKATRSDVNHLDPRWITIITDRRHPLYDERINLPLDEGMIESIQRQGVIKPVVIRFNGDLKELVAGRRRVLHALEVQRRQIAAGVDKKELIKVPCLLKRLTDAQAVEMMIDENEGALPDTFANKALKAQRLLDLTGDRAFVASKFRGVNLDHLLAVIELAKPVQDAIDREDMPLSAAPDMARIRREDQPARLQELIAKGLNRGSNVKKALKDIQKGKEVKDISTFKGLLPSRMRGLAHALESDRVAQQDLASCIARADANTVIAKLLRYAAGDEKALADFGELLEVVKEVDADLNKKGVITGSAKAKKTKAQKEAQAQEPAKAKAKK